jgi:phosphoribosyl 1,2-cyclic phosphate phosphodiesterase
MPFTLTLLGCGTSTGVPLIQCQCAVCRSRNPKNTRLRASAWVQVGGKSLLIDTSTDLRTQALRAKIPRIDAVLYTHPHADHVHGIDELRSYNFLQRSPIPAFGNAWTCRELRIKFSYIFQSLDKVEGGGIPQILLQEFDSSVTSLDVAGIPVIPVSLKHGSQECIGYRIGDAAYITDCSVIPEPSMARLQGLSTLVLDCVRIKSHATHFNIDQALETVERLRPKRTWLTHLGHDFDYRVWSKKLPKGVSLAYDGLKIRI